MKLLTTVILISILAQLSQCQIRITKEWVQQAGYNSQSLYFNYFYSYVYSIDEDALEGLTGLIDVSLDYNIISYLGSFNLFIYNIYFDLKTTLF